MKLCNNCIYDSLPRKEINLKANDFLFFEGDKLDRVFYIEQGYIKVHRYLENGDEKVLSVFGPGDYLALIATLRDNEIYMASAQSMTETLVYAIEKEEIKKAYKANSSFQKMCLDCALNRTDFFQTLVTHSANPDIEDKILNTLENLKKKFGEKLDNSITLPFSKTVLACLIGIRRETLSRHLSNLKKKEYLDIKGNTYRFLK